MKTLARVATSPRSAAPSIPSPFRSFETNGVALRAGEVSVIAGQPGAGKSALALAVALNSGARTLYVSADSSDNTQLNRALSALTGYTQGVAEDEAARDPDWAADKLQSLNIAWSFDSSPTIETIAQEIRAYTEVMGEPPALIIIDSLYDIGDGLENPWAGLLDSIRQLKRIAQQADAAVLVLHHTSEQKEYANDGKCPSLSSLQGKIGPLPALVLTLKNIEEQRALAVAVVKNRHGQANRDGHATFTLRFDPARMQITETQ